ncbi:putative Zn(II)2Cys6 transcription factor [Aspergillus terreus]|uniref:Putative Zn(II)2Cys6 transcription factor n=1 Tax=Aspergillus terreus TaxID=33178 RepID=A0A5M3Z1H2_ASPTE|nr:hypothetical protein ATETN484_0005042000 [Aspergillus terreus]GFF17085.1 putative Zn(II)2Cys6 transcription factor [Aspergillus terreus]
MEPLPRRLDENYVGLDKATQQAQGNPDSVLDPMLKEIATWSSCLDWSPGKDGTSMPESDYAVIGDQFSAGDGSLMGDSYTGSGTTTVQPPPPPPPPAVNGFTSLELLPTPPSTYVLAASGSTIRSSENTSDFAMEERPSCSCLNSAVFLLDELETPHYDGGPGAQGLDSILSIYQEMLFLCKRMINCDACRRKSGSMMMLMMVVERLAILCGEVIDAFIAQREYNRPGGTPVPVAMMEKQPMVLGEYEIEGGDYEVMMGMLMTRRLSELESLLARIKIISSSTCRAHQQARMARVDQHVKELFRKLTSVCPLVTQWRADTNRPVVTDAAWKGI